MSLFVVDQSKCRRCQICVDECPRYLIQMVADDSVPIPIDGAEQYCINCGHCVTVCPDHALSLGSMAPDQCQSVQSELLPGPELVEHFLRSRRSIRTFEQRSVPREVLAELIDIARYAPTGSNQQPVSWLVVEDSQEVRRLAGLTEDWMRHAAAEQPDGAAASYANSLALAAERGLDLTCRGAPHIVIAHTPVGLEVNGVIALTYLELAAYSLGLGACWAGFFNRAANNWPPMQQALDVPEGHTCTGALLVGYPCYRYPLIPLRDEARIAWR